MGFVIPSVNHILHVDHYMQHSSNIWTAVHMEASSSTSSMGTSV